MRNNCSRGGQAVCKTACPFWDRIIETGKQIKRDIRNFDRNNTCERTVLEAFLFSAYRGCFALRTPFRRSGAYGFLMISRSEKADAAGEDLVRHEYGHIRQLRLLGFWRFLFCIGLPSFFEWGDDPNYYERPWEITADLLGNVRGRRHPKKKLHEGRRYLRESRNRSIVLLRRIGKIPIK